MAPGGCQHAGAAGHRWGAGGYIVCAACKGGAARFPPLPLPMTPALLPSASIFPPRPPPLLTGFMSNRGRQNVASFLALDLGVDWRWGADWFESLLLDYDVAS